MTQPDAAKCCGTNGVACEVCRFFDVGGCGYRVPSTMPLPTWMDDDEERRELAERWRVLGKKLRGRSPRQFRKLIRIFASSVLDDEEDEQKKIDSVYPFH